MKKWVIGAVIAGLLISLPAVSFAANDTGLKDLKGHWSEAQVTKAVETGWVNGYPDKTFRPEGTITRAEFTKMALAADPRSWHPGLHEFTGAFTPSTARGTLYLKLSDPLLRDRPEYSIALANKNVFDSATGMNKLFEIK